MSSVGVNIFSSLDDLKRQVESNDFSVNLYAVRRTDTSEGYREMPIGKLQFGSVKEKTPGSFESYVGIDAIYEVSYSAEITDYGIIRDIKKGTVSGTTHIQAIDLSELSDYANQLRAQGSNDKYVERLISDLDNVQPTVSYKLDEINSDHPKIDAHRSHIKYTQRNYKKEGDGVYQPQIAGTIASGPAIHDFDDDGKPDHLIGYIVNEQGIPTHAVISEDQDE